MLRGDLASVWQVLKPVWEAAMGRRWGVAVAMIFAVALAPAVVAAPQAGAQAMQNPAEAQGSQTQLMQPAGPGQAAPPATITLQDALARAAQIDSSMIGANLDARSAREDVTQARNTVLPTFTGSSQYLNTEGNGVTPDGRFVTNDGVHVYRDWVIFKEDLSPANLMRTGYKRSQVESAIANAKVEIARRGLTATVTKAYYTLVVAQRKYATAQDALAEANNFLRITQALEQRGQAPHSDVVKAQIQHGQQETTFDDARLAMEDGRLDLAVLIFPELTENFTVVDDLDSPKSLPTFPEVQVMASRGNPDLRVAIGTQRGSEFDVRAAKSAFLPTLTVETDYGIEANEFALSGKQSAFPEDGNLPNYGYFLQVVLNVPVWDWGTLRSKVKQAEFKQQAAHAELTQKQRELAGELYAAYNEAAVARDAVDKLRQNASLAAESLRLVNLRYQGGLATVLDVVDAETTLTQARNAYYDGQLRYRTSLTALQALTGTF